MTLMLPVAHAFRQQSVRQTRLSITYSGLPEAAQEKTDLHHVHER